MSVIFPLIINMKDTKALLSDNDTEGVKNNLHRIAIIFYAAKASIGSFPTNENMCRIC